MKIQADTINGVYEVEDFDTPATLYSQDTFYDGLSSLRDGEVIAAYVTGAVLVRIANEYGVTPL